MMRYVVFIFLLFCGSVQAQQSEQNAEVAFFQSGNPSGMRLKVRQISSSEATFILDGISLEGRKIFLKDTLLLLSDHWEFENAWGNARFRYVFPSFLECTSANNPFFKERDLRGWFISSEATTLSERIFGRYNEPFETRLIESIDGDTRTALLKDWQVIRWRSLDSVMCIAGSSSPERIQDSLICLLWDSAEIACYKTSLEGTIFLGSSSLPVPSDSIFEQWSISVNDSTLAPTPILDSLYTRFSPLPRNNPPLKF